MTNENVTQEAMSSRYEGLSASENTIAILLDTRSMLTTIKATLLGMEFDPSDNTYVQTRKPLMDEEGVHDYMRLLDSCIGIPQQLSGISEKEKKDLLRTVYNVTNRFIYYNNKKYHITPANYDIIYGIVKVNMVLFLNKSQNQISIDFIKGIFGSRETIQKKGESKETEENQSKGFNFFGGKK